MRLQVGNTATLFPMASRVRSCLTKHEPPADLSRSEASISTPRPKQFSNPRSARRLIKSACGSCQRRKSKCDGQRPSCTRCLYLQSDCTYSAEQGESRWSALKRRCRSLEIERDAMDEVMKRIRNCSELEALTLFKRIRSTTLGGWTAYEDIFSLLIAIRNENSQVASRSTTAAPSTNDQRLPPISMILTSTCFDRNVVSTPLKDTNISSSGKDQHFRVQSHAARS